MAPKHCLYYKHLHTAPCCNLLSRLYQSHQSTCKLPLSHAPSHPASLQLTFALTSPKHLFTKSHFNLISHGFVDRTSKLKRLRMTTANTCIAFTESTSLILRPHCLRVKISHGKFPRLHGVRPNTAYLRTSLITGLSSRSAVGLTKTYHRIASTTSCAEFYPRIAPATSAFTLRLS